MRLSQPDSDIFVPRGDVPAPQALARTTHLCIAAHQDDLEIMAYSAIAECWGRDDAWFTGVVVTDGAGSPRGGPYAELPADGMRRVRRQEQRNAALLGDYSLCIQLGYPSAAVKDPRNPDVVSDLHAIVAGCRPRVLCLHNPADKHDTHVAVLARAVAAVRTLPPEIRPRRVLGCEVWRGLDWLPDDEKVELEDGDRPNLAAALLGVFDSQVSGGKRYDLATLGRRLANATFRSPRAVDRSAALTYAMDLTPATAEPGVPLEVLALGAVDRFRADVQERLVRFG